MNEDKNEKVQESEKTEVKAEVKEVKKSGGFGKFLITILLVLVILFVLAGGAAVAFLYLENLKLKDELKKTQDDIAAEVIRKEEESCLNSCSDKEFLEFASEVWKNTKSYKFAIESDEDGVEETSYGEFEGPFYRKSTTDEYVQDVYGDEGYIYVIEKKGEKKTYDKNPTPREEGYDLNVLITWANDVIEAVNNNGVVTADGSKREYEVSTTKEELDGVKVRKIQVNSKFIHDGGTDEETWYFWSDIDGRLLKYGFEWRGGTATITFSEIGGEFGTEENYSWIKEEVDANI